MRWQFKQFFTGLVLVLLAAGFTSLGFLSFVKRQPESAINDLFSEATYSIIGGSISILVGGTFLWNQRTIPETCTLVLLWILVCHGTAPSERATSK